MISLDQIKLLEQKVDIALKKILELQTVNATLKSKNDDLEIEVALLKEQLELNGHDEELIEKGLLSVIDRLNFVEDTVRQTQTQTVVVDESVVVDEPVDEVAEEIVVDEEETVMEDFSEPQGMLNVARNSAQFDNSAQLDIF